jgi:hypothetical protein
VIEFEFKVAIRNIKAMIVALQWVQVSWDKSLESCSRNNNVFGGL